MLTIRARILILAGLFFLFLGFSLMNYYLIFLGIFCVLSTVISIPIFEYSVDLKDIEFERNLDKEKVFANDFIHVTVKLRNIGNRSYEFIEVYDIFPENFILALGENWIGTRLDKGQEIEYSYVLMAKNRGAYNLGPTQVIIRDRLGFHFESSKVRNITEIIVYPSYEDVRRMKAFASRRRQGLMFGTHATRQKGYGSEFYGIRPYITEDEYRRIDWKATARTGKHMVREFESEKNIRFLILLDASSSMSRGKIEEDKLEYTIRASVLLANLAQERRDSIGLLTFSDKMHYYLPPKPGRDNFFKILDNLSKVQASGKKVLYEAMDFVVKRLPKSSFFFLLTDMEDIKDEFLKAIQLARSYNHNIIIISPFGPWFEARPEELRAVDRALAQAIAEELWEKRMNLIRSLARLNVNVINVSPADYFPTVISEFLKAKKKGMGLI
ncbi:MAG: DUF58 domain-containing protein [Candidatus Helarchaeota archaeon]|nr:DUF58 domain-containing protein [Candidatus Helarchaeota archaeon]